MERSSTSRAGVTSHDVVETHKAGACTRLSRVPEADARDYGRGMTSTPDAQAVPRRFHGRPVSGRWFEELEVGFAVDHAITRTITETDNLLFTTLTMNPAPMHLDEEFASRSEFGGRIVNSLFTLGLLVGITVHELTMGTTVANLGFGAVEFPRPLFHGDTVRAQSSVLAARRSKSRPTQGIVEFEHRGYNQRDELVVRCRRSALMQCRPAD
jgi:acyl dehydratase